MLLSRLQGGRSAAASAPQLRVSQGAPRLRPSAPAIHTLRGAHHPRSRRSSGRGTAVVVQALDLDSAAEAAVEALTAAASAAAAQPLVRATGVPLLDYLMACSLQEAMVRGVQVLAITAAAWVAGEALLRWLAGQVRPRKRWSGEVPLAAGSLWE